MRKILCLSVALVFAAVISSNAQNSAVLVTSRTGNYVMNGPPLSQWCNQLGPAGTHPPNPFTVFVGPVSVTVSVLGTDMIEQEGNGFSGDFLPSDCLLAVHGNAGPLSLQFTTGVSQVGAQFQSISPVALCCLTTITAYDQNHTLIGSFSEYIHNFHRHDGSAPYFGIAEIDSNGNPVAGIYYVEYKLTGPYEFAINELSVTVPTPCPPPNTQGAAYLYGDVFDSVGSLGGCQGCVKEVMPNGTPVRNLPDGSGYNTTAGTAFDVAGNLYVTNWGFGTVSKLDKTGAVVNAALMTPANNGQVEPESIRAVGILPNLSDLKLYVGGPACACVLEYNSAGVLQRTINVAGAGNTLGTDWIEFLTPNILIYTGEGNDIKAYNIATNTQLPDLINSLPGYRDYQLRVGHPASPSCGVPSCNLPDPYILVADNNYALLIDPTPWLSANPIGSVPAVLSQTYSLPGVVQDFALAIDPDNLHFWTGDLQGDIVWQVNTCSAQIGYSWAPGLGSGALTVWGGLGSVW